MNMVIKLATILFCNLVWHHFEHMVLYSNLLWKLKFDSYIHYKNSVITVSYTHLDVYKRQGFKWDLWRGLL